MRIRTFLCCALSVAATLAGSVPAASATPTGPTGTAAAPSRAPSAAVAAIAAATTALTAPVRGRTYDGGLLGGAYRANVTTEAFSAPAVGNVTGHRDGDTDVVAGYLDGTVHVWSQRTGRQEAVVQTGGPVRSSPTLVRTRVGGGLLVLTSNTAGHVLLYAFTGGVPHLLFHKYVAPIGSPSVNGFFGTPTMADLDRNGKYWIVATSWDQHLYVWDLAGHNKPGFPYFAQDTIWSSPTVAMVDGDAYPRIIFGYDCSGVPGESCFARWHTHGGVLVSLRHDGTVAPGFPVFITGQVVWSTPAVASLYGTAAKQIVVGTGLYWPGAGRQTWVFDSRGHRLAVIPMSGRTFSSPAIGDVLGTGRPQIVIGTEDGYTDIIDGAFHRRSHQCTAFLNACVFSHASPIIGDLYGNGQQEIVAEGGNSFYIIDRTGRVVSTVQIKETMVGLAAAPTLVNIGGKATLFFALMARGAGGNHAEVASFVLPKAAGASAWPMFKGDYWRSGAPTKVVPVPAA